MVVGILQVDLVIHDAESIKDKRRVVRSLKDRLHREHLVSVAEVGDADRLDHARLAVAIVGSDGKRMGSVLDAVGAKIRKQPGAEVASMRRQLVHEDQVAELPQVQEPDFDAIDEEVRAWAGTGLEEAEDGDERDAAEGAA